MDCKTPHTLERIQFKRKRLAFEESSLHSFTNQKVSLVFRSFIDYF